MKWCSLFWLDLGFGRQWMDGDADLERVLIMRSAGANATGTRSRLPSEDESNATCLWASAAGHVMSQKPYKCSANRLQPTLLSVWCPAELTEPAMSVSSMKIRHYEASQAPLRCHLTHDSWTLAYWSIQRCPLNEVFNSIWIMLH